MRYGQERFADMIGKKIYGVSVTADKQYVVFDMGRDPAATFRVDGDCCSTSWIEHVELPGKYEGGTLLAVDESGYVDATDDANKNPSTDGLREHEDLKVYSTSFKTSAGDIVLEYRNSSNGYYGGSLERI